MTAVRWLRLAPVFLCIAALGVFLPQTWLRAAQGDYFGLRGLYSAVTEEFVIWEIGPTGLNFRSESGVPYSSPREGRMLTPFHFSYAVQQWGGFPLAVGGRIFTYEEARREQTHTLQASGVSAPPPVLRMLLESEPETAALSLPPDVMAIDRDGLRFIRCDDGSEDAAKSEAFTRAVLEAGAVFPLAAAGNNPSTLKPFDEGMFFVDSEGALFRLKMVKGLPWCRNTGLKVPGEVLGIAVDENPRREFYGSVITEDAAFLIRYRGDLLRLPLESYQPRAMDLLMNFDPLNRTFILSRPGERVRQPVDLLATDDEYRPVRSFRAPVPEAVTDRQILVRRGLALLMPFELERYSSLRSGVFLSLRPSGHFPFACLGAVLWAAVYWAVRRKRPWRENLLPCCIAALSGVAGLAALLVFGPVTEPRRENF
jgi:hypothetical protein